MSRVYNEVKRKIENGEIKGFEEPENLYEKHWREHIVCSECSTVNTIDSNYCVECGHKLRKIKDKNIDKKYCHICGNRVNSDEEYCDKCGRKIKEDYGIIRKCPVCGEWITGERYCVNCGHDTVLRNPLLQFLGKNWYDLKKTKKCLNCGHNYQRYFNYCELCGEKLVEK